MKKIYTVSLQLICILLLPFVSAAWNGDILVHAGTPAASHSMSAKANGTLYVSVPVDSGAGNYVVVVYQSTDNGNTWNVISFPNAVSASPILKTKMVTTGADSVFCFYLTASAVSVLNVESGVMGIFNTTGVDAFDAAASPNGNAVYLFVDEPANNTIKRYGTLDGGVTWGGNTATVTTIGAKPKIYMTGTRLILNYYGPVLADTATSIIRAAFYNESIPGTIAPGTFQDVNTNTTVKKKEFMSVIYSGNVWFYFTEGDAQQVIKCRVSTDSGVTYGSEFVVAGDVTANTFKLDAKHYVDATGAGGGCYLVYFADSVLLPPSLDAMVITNATNANPSFFNAPVSFNDFTVTTAPAYHLPVVMPFTNGSTTDVGVAWVEDAGAQPMVYFDRLSNITVVNNEQDIENFFSVFPNPANDYITISFEQPHGIAELTMFDVTGSLVMQTTFAEKQSQLSISSLAKGIYVLQLTVDGKNYRKRIVKQ